ncbi:UNVERIFIED_CONTAM: hypothetical protein GTU68_036214 [Idotea baltica]|nr:hypothetical protein [Idotea baltica]
MLVSALLILKSKARKPPLLPSLSRVFAGTWNVNGQYPSVGLAGWLACDDAPPDIYAVAFQELDLNKEAFLFNVTAREQEWLSAVLNGVHPKAKYAKVSLVRLVGMMLVVLVQERHLAYVRGVCTDTVGTGILNKWGNKGGVGVRLDLHGTSLCFVNAHMAAHVEEFERRNEDHDCIFLRTAFPVRLRGPPAAIRDHDHVYFLGDMNYRLNLTNGAEIRKAADRGDYESLLKHDQLIDQQLKKRVFHDFNEGKITFKPTYKYDLLSDDWDSSEKARKPAWCDRILYRGEGIALRQYRSHPAVNISDHKPVSAVFDASIKVIDTTRYRRVYEDVMKQLDKLENEFLPQVTVDTTEILLGPVRFMQPQTQSLTIANTGQVPINFEFINKLNEERICKPWLSVRPCAGFIMPGQKCDVALEVVVRKQMAFLLNRGVEKLYDIVVLHLAGGKDIFITVAGDYERSCFGSSLNALVHMNRPLKDTPVSELLDLESEHPKHQRDLPYAVPKELWYLVDHIMSYGLHCEGLFTMPGLQKDLMDIRTALDAGVPGDGLPGHIHSVAEALLVFLDALPEPVVPYRLYERALEATPNFSLCKEVVQDLPDHHRTTFNYLMTFLKELLLNTTDKALDAKTLGEFGYREVCTFCAQWITERVG